VISMIDQDSEPGVRGAKADSCTNAMGFPKDVRRDFSALEKRRIKAVRLVIEEGLSQGEAARRVRAPNKASAAGCGNSANTAQPGWPRPAAPVASHD